MYNGCHEELSWYKMKKTDGGHSRGCSAQYVPMGGNDSEPKEQLMIIRKYTVFLKAAECGNLTRTGELMGYTQSGVSHMMKGLEDEIGFSLFKRGSKGISLTDNGRKLLPIIRKLLDCNEQLEQTVSSINGLITGNICIGAFSSVSTHWLPRIIKSFQSDYPKVNISILEGGIREIDGWLSEGIADIGLYSRQPHQTFDWLPLKEDPLLAILPKDHPLPEGAPFPITECNGAPFIISTQGFDYDIHRVLAENNVTADVKFSSMDDYAIVSMVANGLGISILPELVLKWCAGHVRITELEPRAYRILGIAVPSLKNLSPAVKKFLDHTTHILQRDNLI